MSSYPVQYRNSATAQPYAPGGGYQKPIPIPVPANENFPLPANDNIPPPAPTKPNSLPDTINVRRAAQIVGIVAKNTPIGRASQVVSGLLNVYELTRTLPLHGAEPVFTPAPTIPTFKGWTAVASCSGGGAGAAFTSVGGWDPWMCGSLWDPNLGAVIDPHTSYWGVNPNTGVFWSWDVQVNYGPGIFNRAYPRVKYLRNAGNTEPVVGPDKAPQRYSPRVSPFPMWDPWSLPIAQPVAPPVPWPFKLIPAKRSPGRPEESISVQPRSLPAVRPNPVRQRPGPGTKEKKVQGIKGGVATAQKIAHTLTEFNDLTDAIYKALPTKFQTAKLQGDKLKLIYQHWGDVDVGEMVKNIALNQLTDKVLGMSNAAVDRWLKENASKYTGNPLGITLGSAI